MSQIDRWLESVASQVRVRRIRDTLTGELKDHILLQKEDYMDEGMNESEAETRTIADMGDAVLVGGELDRVHRPRVQWKGIVIALLMLMLGMLLQNVFLKESIFTVYSMKRFALTAITAGVIVLFALTDYTIWLRLTIPALIIWLACWWFRVDLMWEPVNSHIGRWYSVIPYWHLIVFVSPEYLCLTMPVLTAFIICRFRGRGWGAFITSLLLPMAAVFMTRLFSNTGYNYNAMLLMSIMGYMVVLIALYSGFFRVERGPACIASVVLMVYPVYLFTTDFIGIVQNIQPFMIEEVWPVLRCARLLGEGTELTMIDESAYNMLPYSNGLMSLTIHRFGWLPFGLFTAIICGLFIYIHYKFLRMENRMGALMGRAAVTVLTVQTFLYYLCSFTNYVDNLALPLVSFGNTMLVFDGILVGIILSVLRGECLPEPARLRRVSPSGFRG